MASRGSGSQQKGKSFEREIAKEISASLKIDFRRTPSPERWKTIKGDLNGPTHQKTIANRFMWECKNHEKWSILEWYKKAKDDAGPYQTPLVVASRNHEDSYVFINLKDFLKLLVELEGYIKEEE